MNDCFFRSLKEEMNKMDDFTRCDRIHKKIIYEKVQIISDKFQSLEDKIDKLSEIVRILINSKVKNEESDNEEESGLKHIQTIINLCGLQSQIKAVLINE